MSIAKRLVALRGKEPRVAFAAMLGISPNTLRNYESGLSLPNSEMLARICETFSVDPGWLLLGTGGGMHPVGYSGDMDTPEPKECCSSSESEKPRVVRTGNFKKVNENLDVLHSRTAWEVIRVLSQNAKNYFFVSFLYTPNSKEEFPKYRPGTNVAILAKRYEGGYDLYRSKDMRSATDFFCVEFVDLLLTLCKHNVPTFEAHLNNGDIDRIIKALSDKESDDMDIDMIAFAESVKVPTILYNFNEFSPPEDDNAARGELEE